MKKASNKSSKVSPKRVTVGPAPRPTKTKGSTELRQHYDFDYSKARPNRFADQFANGSVAVVLDPDVAVVFTSAESVNTFLRSAIAAMANVDNRKKKRTA